MQNLVNQLPYAFIDTKQVTKSHIPTVNAPARINVPEGQLTNESKICLKRGKPIGSKYITPWKRRTQKIIDTPKEVHDKQNVPIEAYDKQKAPKEVYGEQNTPIEAYVERETPKEVRDKEIALKEAQVPKNYDISMSYVHKGYKWDQNDIVSNNIFVFQVALDIIRMDEDPEPQNVEEC